MSRKFMTDDQMHYQFHIQPLFKQIADRLELFLLTNRSKINWKPFDVEDTAIFTEESDGLYSCQLSNGGVVYALLLHVPYMGQGDAASNPLPEQLMLTFEIVETNYDISITAMKWRYCISYLTGPMARDVRPFTESLQVPSGLMEKFAERAAELLPLRIDIDRETVVLDVPVEPVPIERLYPKLALIQSTNGDRGVAVEVWQEGKSDEPVATYPLVIGSDVPAVNQFASRYLISARSPLPEYPFQKQLKYYWTGDANAAWTDEPTRGRSYATEVEASEVLALLRKMTAVIDPFKGDGTAVEYSLVLHTPALHAAYLVETAQQ